MALQSRLRVRAFLFVVLGGSAALPVALLGVYQGQRLAARELELNDRRAKAAALSAAEQLTIAMEGHVHAAESFSAQVAVRGLDLEALRPVMRAHVSTQPDFLGAYVAGPNGRSLLHAGPNGEFMTGGIDYSDRDYFREITRSLKPAISGAAVGRVTHVLTVQLAAPILDAAGKLEGITCSSLNLGTITKQAVKNVRGLVDGRLVVLDARGRRVADSDAPGALEPDDVSKHALYAPKASGDDELRSGRDEHGRWVRALAVELGGHVAGWRVFALTPQASIAAQARRIRLEAGAIALVSLMAALALAAWLAGWLARPLRGLARASEGVMRGEYENVPPLPENSPLEMVQLSTSVASMIASLRGHARELESEVALRTRDLRDANAELTRALGVIQKNEQAMRADVENARLFQAKLLPALPELARCEVAVEYAALEQVSGDIYDLSPLDASGGGLRIFLADATGHGVQASMRTIALKSTYDRLRARETEPDKLLEALNTAVVDAFPGGELHAAACYVELSFTATGADVRYVNAGGPPLYVFGADAKAREIYAAGPPLGVDHVSFPEPERFRLERGELLLVASDGLIEQWNAERRRFETELGGLALAAAPSASAAVDQVLAAFAAFRGPLNQTDDLTLIALRLR